MMRIAHRGASAECPENTLSAFRRAIELGADAIELDVHGCEGEPVVIHDDTVDRTTNGKGRVKEFTLDALRHLTIKPGEHVPTLDEAMSAIGPEITWFIEVKDPADAALTAELLKRKVGQGWPLASLWLISFVPEALKRAGRILPELRLGASYDAPDPAAIPKALALGASAILPRYTSLRPEFVRQAQTAGLPVFTWTVNRPLAIERLRAMGVDGIISDHPERLLAPAQSKER